MAKLMWNQLKVSGEQKHYDIHLPKPLTVVTGSSSTGKSYLVTLLEREINAIHSSYSDEPPTEDGYVPYTDILLVKNHGDCQDYREKIFKAANKLIIVDNADLIFPVIGVDAEFIRNSGNQFLIFSRMGISYGASPNAIGALQERDNKIQLYFIWGTKP